MQRLGELRGDRLGPSLPAADEDPLPPSFAGHAAGNLRYAVQEPLCPVPLAGIAVLEHRGVELPRRATSDLASRSCGAASSSCSSRLTS
jgi:hypothetical protein